MTDANTDQDKEEEERVIGRESPALFSDTFFMTYWENKVRLSFAEWVEGTKYVRASVMIEMDVVKALIKSLQEIVDEGRAKKKE